MKTVIISDAHVHSGFGNVDSFFHMLEILEQLPVDVVFLGDVFDLWVGLPRYEQEIQRNFLNWCRRNKKKRELGFVEGNHEFFVHESHAQCFTWSTEDEKFIENRSWLFVHGDQINERDRQYLRFRRLTKTPLTKWIVRWMPFGPRGVRFLNSRLKKTNQSYRLYFPSQDVERFAREQFQAGTSRVFIGHFHTRFRFSDDTGKTLWVLPAWLEKNWVAIVDHDTHDVELIHWEKLAEQVGNRS